MPAATAWPEAIDGRCERCDAACPAEAKVYMIHYPDRELAFCMHHFRQHAPELIASGWHQAQ